MSIKDSPFSLDTAFHIGPVIITDVVITTWVLMAVLSVSAWLSTRRLQLHPSRLQAALEMMVETIDSQIRDTMQTSPRPYRGLIGTLFIFILAANWSSLIPGVEPPTAILETDAALALIVLASTIVHGIRTQGFGGYLRTFTKPAWVMIPINVFEHITRTISMIVRLFGNVMSGVFVISIVLSLAGLLVPIPLMALDLLTGTVQAYIFAVLAMVFISAAIDEPSTERKHRDELPGDR